MKKMPETRGYLTDAELEFMVRELEQRDMVSAPPDLQEQILEEIEKERVRAFRRYRFQVLTTVAATVVIVFLLPKLEGLYLEEKMNDNGVFETMLGGVNIFADNNKWNLFRK